MREIICRVWIPVILLLSVVLVLINVERSEALTYTTIWIDGAIEYVAPGPDGNFWEQDEQMEGVGSTYFYLTWDSTFIYVAFTETNVQDLGDVCVAFDANPGNGATGPMWGAQFDSSVAPEYFVGMASSSYLEYRYGDSGGWQSAQDVTYNPDWGLYAGHSEDEDSEIKIPRSWLGNPSSLRVMAWTTDNSHADVWAAFPTASSGGPSPGGAPVTFDVGYTYNNTGSGIAPNVGWQDSDSDWVVETADNCPFDSNSGQEDTDGDGVGDACETLLTPSDFTASSGNAGMGHPDWDPCPNCIYTDSIHITANAAGAPAGLALPISLTLTQFYTDPAGHPLEVQNHDFGAGGVGSGWIYDSDDGTAGNVSDMLVAPGTDQVTRTWQIYDEDALTWYFWVDVSCAGKASPKRIEVGRPSGTEKFLGEPVRPVRMMEYDAGRPLSKEPAPFLRPFPRKAEGGEGAGLLSYDDGTAEIYTGSASLEVVVANRFSAPEPIRLRSVSFYTSGVAAGESADVIIYEDADGSAGAPEAWMEVWRGTVELAAGGFQDVDVSGLLLNVPGAPGAAFYVAVEDKASRSYSLGIDRTGPKEGASYMSTDGGLIFTPLSSIPVVDGNAMIRAYVDQVEPCFIGVAM